MEPGKEAFTTYELRTALDLIHDSLAVTTAEALEDLLYRIKNILPCDSVAGCLKHVDARGLPGNTVCSVRCEFPEGLLQRYISENSSLLSTSLGAASHRRHGLVAWSDLLRTVDPIQATEMAQAVRAYGLSEGVTSWTVCRQKRVGSIFSFSGPSAIRHGRYFRLLRYIVPHFHTAMARIAGTSGVSDASLTSRELVVLQWVQQGKTNWEVAHILGISERTVKFHTNNIAVKLGATSRTHAVAIAMEQRIIASP